MPTLTVQQATHAYVSAFVDELARCGVKHAVVAPGSRSTPLAMILAQSQHIKTWMQLDERSAAFFALGMARSTLLPTLLICTSGTAAANFFPAVAEANLSHIPLLVLTADRPPELRDIAAPQTIDQLHLYGSHVKTFVEMALPEATPEALRYARATACRLFAVTTGVPYGPVHANFPFREPLVPLPAEPPVPDVARSGREPYTAVTSGAPRADRQTVGKLAHDLRQLEHGIIVCGPSLAADHKQALLRLGTALGYPILADGLSQLRSGPQDRGGVISSYDAFLRDAAFTDHVKPEVILRFGQPPTSKPLQLYLQKLSGVRHIMIDGSSDWIDPGLLATEMIQAETAAFCEDLISELGGFQRKSAWLTQWQQIDRCVRGVIHQHLYSEDEFFEGRVFAELADLLPENTALFTSSSMPVRDLDTFFHGTDRTIHFGSNRGANGIDGVISTALGISATRSNNAHRDPVVLTIGDVAFFHDMNGLLAAKLHHLKLTIVLINNNGGGIFSFLPQAAYPEHFEQLFGTPHGLDFAYAAQLYEAEYTLCPDWDTFREAVQAGVSGQGLHIVEVQTNRDYNVTQHRAIWKRVAEALAAPDVVLPGLAE